MSRLYIHRGKGHYLGSVVIVQADNLDHARTMIRKELTRFRLEDEPFNIKLHSKKERIVYVNDGDY